MMRFTFVSILCYFCLRSASKSTTPTTCEIVVEPPWPKPYLLVPWNSTVLITCITKNNLPVWTIDLGNDETDDQLPFSTRKDTFNKNGLFQIESPANNQLQLLINKTESNNQTVIRCVGGENELFQTRVFLYRAAPLEFTVKKLNANSINLSWDQGSLPEALTNSSSQFNLTISYGLQRKVILLNVTRYQFIAPREASPCDVYNFSVSATYVGATYSGNGCSVPSPVLSLMLPSRPSIAVLESSLSTSLEKSPSGGVTLTVSFKPANYCQMYPVSGYTLEVDGPTSHTVDSWRPSSNNNLELELAVRNLEDNQAYMFSIVISNSVANVSTESQIIYTTDIDRIQAVPQEKSNAFMTVCTFISGSDARGCMVVIVGEFGNITTNVTRSNKCTSHSTMLNATHSLSSYREVFGYDIESDESIGMLAVPGVITRNSDIILPCVPGELKPSPSQNIPFWSIGIILGVAVLTMAMILAVIIYCLCRRCKTEKDPTFYHVTRPSAGPAPVTQPPAPTQDFTGEDDETKQQPIYDLPITKQEHLYHVLETSTPRYQFKAEDFHKDGKSHDSHKSPSHSESADSSPGDSLPAIYHDIADVPLVRERQRARVGAIGKDNRPLSSNQANTMPPVYHEITDLSASGATSRLHEDGTRGSNIPV